MNKLINTHIIGRHLKLSLYIQIIPEPCALCNAGNIAGISMNEALSDGFMDTSYLGHTNHICIYCAACIGKGQDQHEWIRCTSFLATSEKLIRLKREDIWKHIFSPPIGPFVFGVSYSCKKHISFKAPVNINPLSYQIQTENYAVKINLNNELIILGGIIQAWYSICRDTKQELTWFTKDEILHGCRNYKRIEQYGVDKYFRDDKIIGPYRNTALLYLLVFALNKGALNHAA